MNKKFKYIKTRDLVTELHFKWLVGEDFCDTKIFLPGWNRAGLELSGFDPEKFDPEYYDSQERRLVLLSHKEDLYLKNLAPEIARERLEMLTTANIPLIIITNKFKNKMLLEVAAKNKQPVVQSTHNKTVYTIGHILNKTQHIILEETEIHGSLISIFGKGILITGQSGIGKSETVLALIKRNHLFVGDDRILVMNRLDNLYGKSDHILSHLMEIRGLGIVDLSKLFGMQYMLNETKIDLVIHLDYQKNLKGVVNRLAHSEDFKTICGIKLPYWTLPVSSGRNIADMVETAVAKLKTDEYNESGLSILEHRLDAAMNDKSD